MDRAWIGVHGCTAGGRVAQRLLTGRQFTLPKRILAVAFPALCTFTFPVFT